MYIYYKKTFLPTGYWSRKMFRVLYVDDEPVLLLLCKTYLERSGKISVDTATSASEALDRLKHQLYDGIISDYQMPGTDGIELLSEIRRLYPDIPFILFTGKSREEIVIEALNKGADFYLQKGGESSPQFTELEHALNTAIDRKRAHEELKESQQRLSDLISFLPDATFAIDREKRVIVWNKAMEEMTGIGREKMLGTGDYSYAIPFYGERRPVLIDLVLSKDEGIEKNYSHIEQQGDRYISELYAPNLYSGKGAFVWFIASPLYDTRGNVIGAIEAIRDITDRRSVEENLVRANKELQEAYERLTMNEEELRENFEKLSRSRQELFKSEERYRNIVEDQTELICRFTPDGKLTFVNEAYSRYFSLDRDTCIGAPHPVVIPSDDIRVMKDHLKNLTPKNPVAIIEHRIVMPDGSVRWQRWSDRAIFDIQGQILEYQSVGRDTTDSKRTEHALFEANKKLNLLSSITRHDILNQLTVLQGALGLVEINQGDMADLKLWTEKAVIASKSIRNQISFTRQYQDIGVQEPRWQNVYTAVLTVCLDAGYANVFLDKRLEDVEIFADPLLRTVFSNLIENTIRHGGNVTRIQIGGTSTPEGYTLVVEDDGDGIANSDKKRVFEKGFGRHTGLGLFLVSEVLGITGLTIRETGEFGKGARFEILVPKTMYRPAAG
jgi:PAS domain S-box-containing protein